MSSLPKISPPRLANIQPRARVFGLLDRSLAGAAAWLESPPGAGKSTLAASYFAARRVPIVWYQVDSGDRDPVTVFQYLSRAFAVWQAGAEDAPVISVEHLADLQGFARRFFRHWFAVAPDPAALVFDSYEQAGLDPVLDIILREALSERPPHVRIVVTSRGAPGARLARTRVSDTLAVLGWDALRLSEGETGEIALAHVNGARWNPEELHALSDGWAAGVRLLLDHGAGAAHEPGTLTREALFGYFASEVFDFMSAQEREFLLSTASLHSVQPDIAAPLARCTAAEAEDTLDSLRRRNLFVELRPGDPPAYVYHLLLREFLQERLRRENPGRARELALQAAGLIANLPGQGDGAFDLYAREGAWQEAGALIVAKAPRLMAEGRVKTLGGWIEELPGAVRETLPWIAYWRGVLQLHTDIPSALGVLESAFTQFQAAHDHAGQIATASAAIDAIYFSFHNLRKFMVWVDRLHRLLDDETIRVPPDLELAASVSLLLTAHHWTDASLDVRRCLARVERIFPQGADPQGLIRAAIALIIVHDHCGNSQRLRAYTDAVDPLLNRPEVSTMTRLQYKVRRGVVGVMYFGEFDNRHVEEAIAELEREGIPSVLPVFLLGAMLVRLHLGDAPGLAILLERLERMQGEGASPSWHAGMRAGLALLEDRPQDALAWVAKCHALLEDERNWTNLLGAKMYSAIVCAICGEHENALRWCEAVSEMLEGHDFTGGGYDPALTKGYVLIKLGRLAEAEVVLRKALSVWPTQDYTSIMVWKPEFVGVLFAFALERGIETDYVSYLIRLRGLPPPSTDTEIWPRALDVRLLGGFSMQVNGQPLKPSRKAPKRLHELLTTIIALEGRDVPDREISDALWPDSDGDVARELLATGLHRLRKLIGDSEAVRLANGKVSLDPGRVWVDALSFERLADRALAGRGDAEPALRLYRGPLALGVDPSVALNAARERLRAKFVQLVAQEAEKLQRQARHEQAAGLYSRALAAEHENPILLKGMARCLQALGRAEEARLVEMRRKLAETAS